MRAEQRAVSPKVKLNTNKDKYQIQRMANGKRIRRNGDDDHTQGTEDITDLIYRRGTDVFFWVDVCQLSILRMIELLHEATEDSLRRQKKHQFRGQVYVPRVHLYIQSYGGDVFAGLSAMAHIRNNRVPITTIADGMVASAATLLLLGGSTRYIMPYSHVLIHQLSTGFFGKHQDLLDESKNASNIMRSLSNIYLAETSLGERRIAKLMAKELDLTTDQCINFGIVTGLFPTPCQTALAFI